jgi:hypothetical protein
MSDEPSPRHASTLDQAIGEILRMPVPAAPGRRVLLACIPNQRTQGELLSSQPRQARRRLAAPRLVACAAAAVLAGVAIGWVVVGSMSSTVLAEVIQATTRHKIVRCNLHTSADILAAVRAPFDKPEFVPATNDEVIYFDLTAPRFRIESRRRTMNDAVQSDWLLVQDNEQDRILNASSLELVLSEKEAKDATTAALIREFRHSGDAGKKARLFRISGDGLVPFTNVKTDKTLLEILEAFRTNKAVVTTHEVLDGKNVAKYRLEQGKMTSQLWVDPITMLPIRIEQELLSPRPNVRRWQWTYTNFQWDADGANADELFSVQPPVGYAIEDHTNAGGSTGGGNEPDDGGANQ